VASNPEPRNWRANIISVMVILFVLVLVSLSVIYMTPKDPGPRVRGAKLQLDDILGKKFTPNPMNATWNKDSGFYYMNYDGALCLFDVKSQASIEILDNTTFRVFNSHKWVLSDDRKFLLIVHDSIQIYRHSSIAKYTIVSLTDRHFPLIKVGVTKTKTNDHQEYLQAVQVLPNGGLIIVKDNNIFYKSSIKSDDVKKLTEDGEHGNIYNGLCDWLYEEEILGSDVALWPSLSGDKIVYLSFNDSEVEQVSLQHFGADNKATGKNDETREKELRYPKAGEKNPNVKIVVQNLKKIKDSINVQPPKEIQRYFKIK